MIEWPEIPKGVRGVYEMTFAGESRTYIGSANDIRARLFDQKSKLRAGIRKGDLAAAFTKAGGRFDARILEVVPYTDAPYEDEDPAVIEAWWQDEGLAVREAWWLNARGLGTLLNKTLSTRRHYVSPDDPRWEITADGDRTWNPSRDRTRAA
jgi:hypothetical protein